MKKLSIDTINPRDRFRILLFLICFFLVLFYQLSLKNTLELYQVYQQNKTRMESAENAPMLIRQYESEIQKITQNIPKHTYNRQTLFEMVNTFCSSHNLSLVNFYPEKRKEQNEFYTITNKIEVQGSYTNILKLIYHVEQEEQNGHIASCHFQIEQAKRRKKRKLKCLLYLQHVQAQKTVK